MCATSKLPITMITQNKILVALQPFETSVLQDDHVSHRITKEGQP